MLIETLIAARLAAPKQFRVITTYDDGVTKQHETETLGQANTHAIGECHKIGRVLINRETGKKVVVVSVQVVEL